MDLGTIIIKPIITEKSTDEASKKRFTFMVLKSADKKKIKKAVEEKFKVNVESVSTSMMKGKKTKAGGRRKEIKKSDWKKAVVQIAKDQKIDLFDVGV